MAYSKSFEETVWHVRESFRMLHGEGRSHRGHEHWVHEGGCSRLVHTPCKCGNCPKPIDYPPNIIRLIQENLTERNLKPQDVGLSDIMFMSEDEQLTIIEKDGNSIQNVLYPSEELQIAAVKQNPEAIKYIVKPCAKAVSIAIESDCYPSYRLQETAVTHGKKLFTNITSKKIIKKYFANEI